MTNIIRIDSVQVLSGPERSIPQAINNDALSKELSVIGDVIFNIDDHVMLFERELLFNLIADWYRDFSIAMSSGSSDLTLEFEPVAFVISQDNMFHIYRSQAEFKSGGIEGRVGSIPSADIMKELNVLDVWLNDVYENSNKL
jgi:hypothetical protein